MSLILDALRKSEASRQRGRAPELDTIQLAPGSPTGRRPRRGIVLATLAVTVVLALGLVLAWQFLGQRPAAEVQTVAERSASTEPESVTTTSEAMTTQREQPAEAAIVAEQTDAAISAAEQPDADQRSRQRPVRQQPPQRQIIDQTQAVAEGRVPWPSEDGRERLGLADEAMAEMERLESETDTAARPPESASRSGGDAQRPAPERPQAGSERQPAAERGRSETQATEPEPREADYVLPWELPLEVRRELPALDLSMLVYSEDVRHRFVLINGERYREGDSLGDGARLEEIRRNGALVEFRNYRILLGRDR